MATKSKIVEKSFRIGSGRYIQEDGAVLMLGREVQMLNSHAPLVIGGPTALALTREMIAESLGKAGISFTVCEYSGFCNPDRGEEIAGSAAFDCVVGVGGGNLMDMAKLVAALKGTPVINVPTSSATCAAYTPLSVMYNDNLQTIGSRHHAREVNAVLADMNILCRQPTRLLVAGVYDALAKLVETKQRLLGKTEDEVDIGLRSSFVLSQFTYDRILQDLPQAFEDVKHRRNTKAVYDMVYLTVAVTGVISGLARGSNQCAIAHKVYESCRTLFPQTVKDSLHGELVGIGLLPQLIYNGEEECEQNFRAQMKQFGLPATLPEVGIPATDEAQTALYEKIAGSSAMAGANEEELERLKMALQVIF